MAKNRNKKKRNGAKAMDISENAASELPQAMDMSESGAPKPAAGAVSRKMKGRPMKRTKNVRKMKSVAKAIAQNEKDNDTPMSKDNITHPVSVTPVSSIQSKHRRR
ncbi:hypothetical protein SLA2020_396610 [Shorea laevis]